ncbi:MAG: ATP-binding protein [Anaerolineae bacterium]|jgi:signal transduction histidine kinase|nr:ATP-binding protein [Anaerolineae bacterium]
MSQITPQPPKPISIFPAILSIIILIGFTIFSQGIVVFDIIDDGDDIDYTNTINLYRIATLDLLYTATGDTPERLPNALEAHQAAYHALNRNGEGVLVLGDEYEPLDRRLRHVAEAHDTFRTAVACEPQGAETCPSNRALEGSAAALNARVDAFYDQFDALSQADRRSVVALQIVFSGSVVLVMFIIMVFVIPANVKQIQKNQNRLYENEVLAQEQNKALVRANRELAVARRQAEAANRMKSQFLATMSHELRTPLNAVIGYSQIQLAGMVGEISPEQRNFQERIVVNAEHLLGLINEVLDLSKIEAGRMELNDKPFNLREMLKGIQSQNAVLAEKKGLTFRLDIDDRLPDVLVGDVSRIRQIMINLVSNAIKFTDSGSVMMEAAPHTKEAWRVTVTDTGVGIPSHLQETVFDEFRQAEDGIQRGGTGLGLAIVRKLVLMMGGNIRLSSEVGQGTSFTIILPMITEQEWLESLEDTEPIAPLP